MNISPDIELDLWLRFVDNLPKIDLRNFIPGCRLAWKLVGPLELSVAGPNLLDRNHPEIAIRVINTQATQI